MYEFADVEVPSSNPVSLAVTVNDDRALFAMLQKIGDITPFVCCLAVGVLRLIIS